MSDHYEFNVAHFRIAYEWYAEVNVEKDIILAHRTFYDGLSRRLIQYGLGGLHDQTKALLRKLDKDGYLGGTKEGRTFEEQHAIVLDRTDCYGYKKRLDLV